MEAETHQSRNAISENAQNRIQGTEFLEDGRGRRTVRRSTTPRMVA
jgi:hypothetical protein